MVLRRTPRTARRAGPRCCRIASTFWLSEDNTRKYCRALRYSDLGELRLHAPLITASSPGRRWLVSLALIAACLVVYAQTFNHGFLNFDDNSYIFENPPVRQGITAAGLRWAFTTID